MESVYIICHEEYFLVHLNVCLHLPCSSSPTLSLLQEKRKSWWTTGLPSTCWLELIAWTCLLQRRAEECDVYRRRGDGSHQWASIHYCSSTFAEKLGRNKPVRQALFCFYTLRWRDKYVKGTQSCPTLHDPMDCIPPDCIHRILQARILEWVVCSLLQGISQPRDQTQVSRIAGDSLPSEPPRKPGGTHRRLV